MIESQTISPFIIIQGNFDDLRTIDIRFMQEASKLGSLHVMLYADELASSIDGKILKFSLKERSYFVENIRYVDRVSILESSSADEIPLPNLKPSHEIIWAVREADASDKKKTFCIENGITYRVISEKTLGGFPLDPVDENTGQKKVMVSGCFDWVHSGHIRFFEEAAEFGNLYVVIGHDKNLLLLKGEGHPLFSQEERRYWVQSIRLVKRTLISSGNGWLDAKPEIEKYKPDIFIVNRDGDRLEKRQLLKELGIEYKVLERKPKPGLPARISTNLRGF